MLLWDWQSYETFLKLKHSTCVSFSAEPECSHFTSILVLSLLHWQCNSRLLLSLHSTNEIEGQMLVHVGKPVSYFQKHQPSNLESCGKKWYLRSSPTCKISQSILVSSMALRPKGHSCLSSRLLFSRTIYKKRMQHTLRTAAEVLVSAKTSSITYPNIGVLMKFGQVEHVVQCKHPWRSLSKIHGWIDVILWKKCVEKAKTN